jgi:hypothetical protein
MDLIEENNKKLSCALSNHKYYEKNKKEKKPQKDLYKELVIKIKILRLIVVFLVLVMIYF